MSSPLSQSTPPAALAALTAELVDIAERLTQVLDKETALIRAMRVKEIGPLQADKTDLTALYQQKFKALTTVSDGRSLPASLKERLASSGQRLATAVADNALMLRVGKVATERLISSIVEAVKKQTKTGLSYAPQRNVPRNGFMTAAAIDRRL